MEKSSRNSSELEYHDSESSDGLLPQADHIHEKVQACKASRAPHTSVLIPWILCIVLLIALGASALKKSQDCAHGNFWNPYEFSGFISTYD